MDNQKFVVLHKISDVWYSGKPTTLEQARTIRDGLLKKWPDDEIKIELNRVYKLKDQNGTEGFKKDAACEG